MEKQDLIILREKLSNLSTEEKKGRDLYLKGLANGKIQGPSSDYPSISKKWLTHYDDKYIMGDIEEKRVFDCLYNNNKKYLNDIAFLYFGKKITYGEFFSNVDRTINALQKYDVKEGDFITLIMPSTPETFYLFYALNRLGITANFIDPRYNSQKIKNLTNAVDSKALFVLSPFADKVEEVEDELCTKNIVSISPSVSFPIGLKSVFAVKNTIDAIKNQKPSKYPQWNEFIKYENTKEIKEAEYNPNFPVAVVYTGGTTGIPKAALMTTKGINTIAYHQKCCMPLVERQSKYLDIMPPFIAFGLTCGLNNPLNEGAILDVVPSFDHNKFDKLLLKHKPNHVIGVPSFWTGLTKSKLAKKSDFSFLLSLVAGGDGINATEEKAFNDFIVEHGSTQKLTKGYGMTEGSSCTSFTCTPESDKLGSVGVPLVKDNYKIVNPETGEECTYNEEGEIYISTPSIMGGYLNNEEETKKALIKDEFGETWIKSGDVGYIDNDGCIFIVDRIKNMIVRPDGFKVWPKYIEQYAEKIQNVKSCKVIGAKKSPDATGEFPVLYITTNEECDYEELKGLLYETFNTCLPEYQIPIDIIVKEELPLTSIGKVDIKTLKTEFENNTHKKLQKKI